MATGALFLMAGSAVAVLATAVAAFTDSRTGHIPNWITFPPILLAPVANGVVLGLYGVQMSLLGLFVCGFLPYLMFRQGGMGGGDVKLFAAIGALTGVRLGLEAQLASLLVGALYSLFRLVQRGRARVVLRNAWYLSVNWLLPEKMRRPVEPAESDSLRLGTSIFIGTTLALGWRWASYFA
ncbi:MAG: prepilin peptidase [Myxococcales bacterium]|nr:prepilin peptidase [Myxococcales bacterium]